MIDLLVDLGAGYDHVAVADPFLHPRDNAGVLIQRAEIGPDVMTIVNRDLAALIPASPG